MSLTGKVALCIVLALGVLGSVHVVRAQISDQRMEDTNTWLAQERERAHMAIEAGNPAGAAEIIAFSLRAALDEELTYPTDDMVDEVAQSLRVGVFCLMYLLSDEERKAFIETYLQPDAYQTDEILILSHDISDAPSLEETYKLIERLENCSNSQSALVRLAALATLANPYLFEFWPVRPPARARLAQEFPDLAITKCALRWSLERAHKKGEPRALGLQKLLERELASEEEQEVLASDPSSMSLLSNRMNLDNPASARMVDEFCAAMDSAPDWRVRYGYVNLAQRYRGVDPKKRLQNAIESLANADLDTPDVVHAKCYAFGYAIEDKDLQRVIFWGEDLLAVARIHDCFDRPLHEAVFQAGERYAEFLNESGRKEDAIHVYRRLSDKYPSSALAAKWEARAQEIATCTAVTSKVEEK